LSTLSRLYPDPELVLQDRSGTCELD